jgi:hypothetical protein
MVFNFIFLISKTWFELNYTHILGCALFINNNYVAHVLITNVSSIDFPLQTQFLKFVWISSKKINSIINIFHTLGLICFEINSIKFDLSKVSNSTKKTPKF